MEAVGAFDRWRALTAADRRLAVRSSIALGATVVALRVVKLERILRIASRPVSGQTKTVIDDVVTAVDRAGRYVPGASCLSRSLALAWLLRGNGVEAVVRIGVKTAGPFEAHAWVEAGGAALTTPGGVADRFAVIL